VTLNTPGVRVVAYAWHGMDVAMGEKPNMVFSGFASGKITDTTGPLIAVRPVYTGTTAADIAGSTQGTLNANGVSASLPFTLSISLFDSSGIDAVSTGPDEGLTYAMSGVKNLSRQNINRFFTQGTIPVGYRIAFI